ncbi:MAG: DNA repair protein RadA, partial [Patescibacteria group bacterium]
MKSSVLFMCNSCGNEFPKWSGQCSICHEWNTLVEVTNFTKSSKARSRSAGPISAPLTPKQAIKNESSQAFPTHIEEFDRVLGTGLTPGGVYLIAGQPGIGKSTLLTQLAISLPSPLLYICSEENVGQVATRITRLTKKDTPHIQLLNTSSLEEILGNTSRLKPKLVIVDSIQSIATENNPTTAGSPSQIRDCASLLIRTAKETNTPVIIVGHVTKEGTIAGPKLLEHMVDTVLELTGDRQHELRLLRGVKNRFGPTDETGIFRMTGNGLEEVSDPSKFLLEGRLKGTPGSILALVMEGTRPMTAEIQALVVESAIPIPRRVAKGINTNRLQLICAILTKHLKLPLGTKDVFVNITGGLTVNEPGVDLAIALAIISSVKNKALPDSSICFGELGLLGEIRSVAFGDRRLKEAKKLGYKHIYSPSTHPHIQGIVSSR